jgi:hypothetical protein
MSGKRQKKQLWLAFMEEGPGAARTPSGEGTEPSMAERETGDPAEETTACLTNRTAVYGPVRTVVWEGRGRETPSYPDPGL